jgi:hypothetical protein
MRWKTHLDDDETGSSAIRGGEVYGRLIVRDIKALDGGEGAVGEGKKGSKVRLHVDLRLQGLDTRVLYRCGLDQVPRIHKVGAKGDLYSRITRL